MALDFNNPEVLLSSGALVTPALAMEAARYVSPDDFQDKRLGRIWKAVIDMANEGMKDDAIDLFSVARRFAEDPAVQQKVKLFCSELMDGIPKSISLVTLAQRVRRRATMRVVQYQLEDLQDEISREIQSSDGDIPNLDERLATISIDVTNRLDATQRRTVYQNYTKEISNYLDDLAAFDTTKYIPTGLPKLDSRLGGGLRPGQLHAILGGTGSGKTALASQLCDSAVIHGHRAILFSMEVDPIDIHIRDVERKAGRSRWDLKYAGSKDQAGQELAEAQIALSANKHGKIVYGEPISIEGIRQVVLTENMRGGKVTMIAVDHAQVALPSAKEKATMPRYLIVKGVAEGLRVLARNLGIAVVLTAQLNPPPKDQEPSMDQVRESRDINNTAEVVMVIFHKRSDVGDESIITESYIRVEKIRAGVGGKIKVHYNGEVFRFEEKVYDAAAQVAAGSVG